MRRNLAHASLEDLWMLQHPLIEAPGTAQQLQKKVAVCTVQEPGTLQMLSQREVTC